MEESWRCKWKVARKWNVIVWKGILFLFSVSWHHSCVLNSRHSTSSEAFVNRGLTVLHYKPPPDMPVCIKISIFQTRKFQQNVFFTRIICSVMETLEKREHLVHKTTNLIKGFPNNINSQLLPECRRNLPHFSIWYAKMFLIDYCTIQNIFWMTRRHKEFVLLSNQHYTVISVQKVQWSKSYSLVTNIIL